VNQKYTHNPLKIQDSRGVKHIQNRDGVTVRWRENRSKLYGISTLCSQRPPASWWLPPQFTCLLFKL